MRLILGFIILTLSACTPPPQATLKASSSSAASSLAPSKWPTSAFPLNIKISDNFSNLEVTAIEDMGDAWSDSIDYEINLLDIEGLTAPKGDNLSSYSDSLIGVYKLNQWPADLPGSALAVTQIYGTRKNIGKSSEYIRIDHADILVNYENFDFTTDYSWGYDLQTIILHEMGHLLGLYHDESSVDQSVMYPTITRYVDNRYPLDRDINNLSSKYGISRSASESSNFAFREPAAQDNDDSAEEESVIIQFEIMSDGNENIKMIKR